MRRFFTSESVTEGHPDKMADQISDAVLDEIMSNDPMGRVACETFVTTGLVFVAGEITTNCYVDIPHIVRETVRHIGYTRAKYGFDCDTCAVMSSIDEQSADIALGVDKALEQKEGDIDVLSQLGAGDQGMMFGYACDETKALMPLPINLAHNLTKKLAEVRRKYKPSILLPDGKSQVTVEYDEKNKPIRVDTIVVSAQHKAEVGLQELRDFIIENVIKGTIAEDFLDKNTRYLINPTGRFVIGGPQGDTGLTGRKIIVDTYGGMARHGGGAFSGKDPTKVDRSASYLARYIAKNIVAADLASRVELQIAYAIGVAEPVSMNIDTFGTGKVDDELICRAIKEIFDARPSAIISNFNLRRPIYKRTAAYGHFGLNTLDMPWEQVDKIKELRHYFDLE